MRQTTNCQLLVMSLYKPHCQTKELKQCFCRVTSAHCEGEKEDMRETRKRQREKLHHKAVRLAVYSKQIKFVVFKSNTALCANVCD